MTFEITSLAHMLIILQGVLCIAHQPYTGKKEYGAQDAAGNNYLQIIGIPRMVDECNATYYQRYDAQ